MVLLQAFSRSSRLETKEGARKCMMTEGRSERRGWADVGLKIGQVGK
jgi:hypothetical protein